MHYFNLKMRARALFLIYTLLSCCSAQAADYLFRNGSSDYTIVISSEASKSERTAAKELQKYVKDISGAILNISEAPVAYGKMIYIGYNQGVPAFRNAEQYDEEDEGFTYRKVGHDLIVYGGRHRGTLYGVFSFLENELGVRWYTPTVTVVPKRMQYRIPLLDHSENPAIKVRFTDYYATTAGGTKVEWSARNKENMKFVGQKNDYGDIYGFNRSHTMGIFVPASKYFEKHPEYFALKGGKRVKNGQLCLTNPEVLQICIKEIKNDIATRPSSLFHSLSQNDNYNYCECEKCKAVEEKYGGHSGLILWFVNQVADAIKEEYPNALLNTYAYQYSARPPVGIKPRDNVAVILTTSGCCLAHPFEERCKVHPYDNDAFMDNLEGWSKICDKLFIWEYVVNINHPLSPFVNIPSFGPNVKSFADNHVSGIFAEGRLNAAGGSFAEMKNWIFLKLMWNPQLNTDNLAKDFIYGYYGKSAPYIWKYFKLCKTLVDKDTHFSIRQGCDDSMFTDAFIKKAFVLMKKALVATADDKQILSRVEEWGLEVLYIASLKDSKGIEKADSRKMFYDFIKKHDVGINPDFRFKDN